MKLPAQLLVIGTAAFVDAETVDLSSLSTRQATELLRSWDVPQLAATLQSEGVTGATLAYAEKEDFPADLYPTVKPHQWKTFWRNLDNLRDEEEGQVNLPEIEEKVEVEVKANGSRRKLASMEDLEGFSGLEIAREDAFITMGSPSDCAIYRDDSDASLHFLSGDGGVVVDAETLTVNGEALPSVSTLLTSSAFTTYMQGSSFMLNQRDMQDYLDNQQILWLRGEDFYNPDIWSDHRGSNYNYNTDAVTCTGVTVSDDGFARFGSGDSSYCQTGLLDISPSALPQVTISLWVRLESYANQRGWVVSHDDGACDRSILMHDDRWGSDDDGIGYMGIAAGCNGDNRDSGMGVAPLGEWLHLVAVFDSTGDSAYMYANMRVEEYPETEEGDGDNYISIGKHDSASDHYADVTIAEMRVYGKALTPQEVAQLHVVWDPTLLLWLEAADYNPLTPSAWTDRRDYGVDTGFSSPYSLTLSNVVKNDIGKLLFGTVDDSWNQYVKVNDLDVSPSLYNDVTISIWVKLNSYLNERGWIVHTDDGGYDRSILMHDTRFGEDGDGVGYTAIATGDTYDSDAGVTALDEWVHIVGVWSEGGASHVFRNGVQYADQDESTDNSDNDDFLMIGGWGSDSGTDHSTHCEFDSIRVYGRQLSAEEVDALFAEESKQYLLAL